ncbi:MAG: hypothetical protein JO301_11710 [Chitinophagaceae bacterium]|nr:hypothetical protein [Chitinophagaceae bacterium]
MKKALRASLTKYLLIAFAISLGDDIEAQKTTVIVSITTITKPLDSVSVVLRNVVKTKPIVNRTAVFDFDLKLKGKQVVRVIYGDFLSYYDSSNFSGIGLIGINIRNRSTGKAGPLATVMEMQEYGQVTLQSSGTGIDFMIDDDQDSQGSTNDIRSIKPAVPHTISWKQNNFVLLKTNIELCSGCRKILTYNPKTKKVTIE